jgi:hypothetical protein
VTATLLDFGVDVGDVVAVATNGWAAKVIDLGERLAGKRDLDNHVAVVHHIDAAGVPWGVEGKPGGVGWVDMRGYLGDRRTRSNAAQPKTAAQRAIVGDNIVKTLSTQYDWPAIAGDALMLLAPDLPKLFAVNWHGQGAPGHVVCSSYAAWLYRVAGLAHPSVGQERFCEPADWTSFDETKAWQ